MVPDIRWFLLVPLLLILLWLLHKTPDTAERIEDWIKGLFILALVCIGALLAIYGIVRFVHWAWYN
jgi:bacteriorhodopsin